MADVIKLGKARKARAQAQVRDQIVTFIVAGHETVPTLGSLTPTDVSVTLPVLVITKL